MQDIDHLTSRLEALQSAARELAEAMRRAAVSLEEGSLELALHLPEQIEQLSKDYWELGGQIQELARRHGLLFEPPAGFRDFRALLQTAGEQLEAAALADWRQTKERVLGLLEKVERLAHREGTLLESLEIVKRQAADLATQIRRLEWPETLPEQTELASGQHPLEPLLRIVEEGDRLSDQEWERLEGILRRAYPSELAISALRGKLVVAPISPHPAPPGKEAGVEAPVMEAAVEEEPSVQPLPRSPEPVEEAQPQPAAGPEQAEPVRVTVRPVEVPLVQVSPQPDLSRVVWGLIKHGHLGLAYHLARYLEECGTVAEPTPPAWLLRAAALGPVLCLPGGDIAVILQQDLGQCSEDCFRSKSADVSWATRCLAMAASLRPAILAPQTGAAAVLRQLHLGEFPHLFDYCQEVAEFSERNIPVTPAVLRGVRDEAALQEEMDRLRAEASSWWGQAPTFTTKYAPATKVWRKWLERGQWVEDMLRPVLQNNEAAAPKVSRWLNEMQTDKRIDKEVQQTDREVLRRLAGRDITAEARMQLRSRAHEALDLARRWVSLIQIKQQSDQRDYVTKAVGTLRSKMMELTERTLEELHHLRENNGDLPIEACAPVCESAIENVRQLFDPPQSVGDSEPRIEDRIHVATLHVPGLRATEKWEVRWVQTQEALNFLCRVADGYQPRWEETFENFCEKGDHRTTARILEFLQRAGCIEGLEALEAKRARSKEHWKDRLEREIRETELELEKAVAYGLVNEAERGAFAPRIETIKSLADETEDFGDACGALEQVRLEIRKQRDQRVEECRQRMMHEVSATHPLRARIEELLGQGDVSTAHEYVDMASREQPSTLEPEARDALSEFFPGIVKRLEEYLESTSHEVVTRLVKERRRVGDLDLGPLSGKDAERAADALSKWFEAKRVGQCTEAQARDVLTFLGFQIPEVTPIPGQRRGRWMKVRTVPLRNRDECPIPLYGTDAQGEYRLFCVWDRPNVETLLQDVAEVARPPVLVFFFGRLTEHRRRNLARLCRERRKTFVVLDDLLLIYLCSVPGVRLGAFFRCALPFTYAEAYVTSAGRVPAEMFYGRQQALQSVTSPEGACFVYGGRQLGKTALLREAERTFHAPGEGRVALWVDLKVRGIGYDRALDDLWQILDEELRRLSVPLERKGPASAENVLDAVYNWLAGKSARRLLVLLDEADRFLAGDAREDFVRAARLKGLMDRTNRRFKVVFAGLHDVQRTTTLANHPLAHFGTPVCVGPLLEGGEWREARALIEQPFASLGYRFVNADVVTRILSQTNYYPSLIQLYCQQLFSHLLARPSAFHDWRQGPPFTITEQQVDEAYRSQDLRRAIRDRLLWTLQLDKRYEVIAYAMAFEITAARPEARSEVSLGGFDTPTLQSLAPSYWPEGFEDTKSFEAFNGLLDEMVGLGVLRHADRGHYAFRSPNVIALLGTEDEILSKLSEPREPDPQFSPSVMRSPMETSGQARRSPLTWQQESALHKQGGVFLVTGCRAAGLDDCAKRFGELFGSGMRLLRSHETWRDLETILRSKRGDRPIAVAVPSEVHWESGWVRDAVNILARRTKAPDLKVIFLCSTATLWNFLANDPESGDFSLPDDIHLLTLTPWGDDAVRVWLDDIGIVANREQRHEIREVTGYWPYLLYEFQTMAAGKPLWQTALDELRNKLDNDSAYATSLLEQFEIASCAPGKILHWLSLQEEFDEEDVIELLKEMHSSRQVQLALEWGRKLNFITYAPRQQLRLDTIVRRLASKLS